MKNKQIIFNVELARPTKVKQGIPPTVFTNDANIVEFIFNVTDLEVPETATAEVNIFMRDGSFFQKDALVEGSEIRYTLSDTEGKHAGLAQIQMTLSYENKRYSTNIFQFKIDSGLNDKVAVEVLIQDWDTITTEARQYLEQMADYGTEFSEIIADARTQVNANVVEGAVENKFNALESEYAQDITSLKQSDISLTTQLQQTEQELNAQLAVEKARIDSFTTLASGSTTGDAELFDSRIRADGYVEPNVGSALRSIGSGVGIVDGAIGLEKLNSSLLDIDKSQNIFNIYEDVMADSSMDAWGGITSSIGNYVLRVKVSNTHNYSFVRENSSKTGYTSVVSRIATYDINMNLIAMVSNNTDYKVDVTDPNVFYACFAIGTYIDYNCMILEDWDGVLPTEFINYYRTVKLSDNAIRTIPQQKNDWQDKKIAFYGDSITAITNGLPTSSWGYLVKDYFKMNSAIGRGIGGKTFAWSNYFPVFLTTDGSYHSRNDTKNLETLLPEEIPANTTAHYGVFCSWDRIKSMFPVGVKENIDVVFIMGGSNDLVWSISLGDTVYDPTNTTDEMWASDTTYREFDGDYKIDTFKGSIASTIMKFQKWMPDTILILGTPLGGMTGTTGLNMTAEYLKDNTGLKMSDYAKALKEVAFEFSVPCIDVFGASGVNQLNSGLFIADGVHPYDINGENKGNKALARVVIGGLKGVMPNI